MKYIIDELMEVVQCIRNWRFFPFGDKKFSPKEFTHLGKRYKHEKTLTKWTTLNDK